MKRLLLVAVLAATLLPVGRDADALPAFGHYVVFYANACNPNDLVSAGSPGDYLGDDLYDCYSREQDGILESGLTGSKNWKEEYIIDCETGAAVSHKWYVGGYANWREATPTECIYDA